MESATHMSAAVRQQVILDALAASGRVDIAELRGLLTVSEMTIRRDLGSLESDGVLRRVHGGATSIASGSYEPPYAMRQRQHHAAKRAIAEAIAEEIQDGQTVIVDGGTTGLAVAEMLIGRVLTVCPLSMRVATALAGSSSLRLLVPGGFVRPGEQSFVGAETARVLAEHLFDVYVLTVSGLHAREGLTEWNTEDALVKRAALASSTRTLVAADSSKLGQTAFTRVAALSDIDLLVTDARGGIDPALMAALDEAHAELKLVTADEDSHQREEPDG